MYSSSRNIFSTLFKNSPTLFYRQAAFISNQQYLDKYKGKYSEKQLEFYRKHEPRYKPLEDLMNKLAVQFQIKDAGQLRYIYDKKALKELSQDENKDHELGDLREPTIEAGRLYQEAVDKCKEAWRDECGKDMSELAERMTGLRTHQIITTRAVSEECSNGAELNSLIHAMQFSKYGSILGEDRIDEFKKLIKDNPGKLINMSGKKRDAKVLKSNLASVKKDGEDDAAINSSKIGPK